VSRSSWTASILNSKLNNGRKSMPTYQVTFEAEKIVACRNYFAPTVMECIDKVLESQDKSDWHGLIISIKLNLIHK